MKTTLIGMFLLICSLRASAQAYEIPIDEPNFRVGYCYINIYADGKIVDRQQPMEKRFYLPIPNDFTDDVKFEWKGQNVNSTPNINCKLAGEKWTSELYAADWKYMESRYTSNADQPYLNCIRHSLKSKGTPYYTERIPGASLKYIGLEHQNVKAVSSICNALIKDITLKTNYPCNLASGKGTSLCEDRLTVNRGGRFVSLNLEQAIEAKLKGEEVTSRGWESQQGVQDRQIRDVKLAKEKEENEARLVKERTEKQEREKWLQTPEGQKQIAEEATRSKKAQEEQANNEAQERAKLAKEYPYYAVFKCTTNDFPVNFISCLYGGGVNTEIELKNGSDYKLYQGADFSNKFEDYEGGKLVKLKTSFDITAQNASNNLILGLTIYDRATNKIVFQKQVSRFGVIKVHN